ncbi:MAG: pantoate--beta-alanine ligase [Chloroflexi bacterium]|nr:pantoate--beta-alanine ligase [Chloroflexota bacterium]MBT4142336.1 pantoate--beta-alanine ligase [Chloroflexota bacterium]MBT4341259.1 pantoate--beta-alanine ligase [Chloroflexota bacterium]MBT4942599.1 pantoate--beta-alanine ligase [Chloroflexota bacterium]MBT5252307.1 pantoate--beta-alanine ligase [Chloroflexota bacterium]
MQVIRTAADMRGVRRGLTGTVGLVATLGGVHRGHTAHLDTIRPHCDVMIGSLFLNPTQFGENEDLSTYPSHDASDLAEFEKHGADFVFAPSKDEIYPPGEVLAAVNPGPVANLLEGAHRACHFEGVATVVARLFSIISPTKATFGEKDVQQLRVIQHVNESLGFGIEIIPIPTVREEDGLAISTRNAYLSLPERKAATILFKALTVVKLSFDSGERSGEVLRFMLDSILAGEPLAEVDYASIADVDTFEELDHVDHTARALLAVKIGNARLIDNFLLA